MLDHGQIAKRHVPAPTCRHALILARWLHFICILSFSFWIAPLFIPSANSSDEFQFLRLQDDLDPDGVPGRGVTIDADGNIFIFRDFGDLHSFNVIYFDSLASTGLPYSGAVDVLNVVWLGDPQPKIEQDESNIAWQPAEALRMRDWQLTGVDGAPVAKSNSVWPIDVSPIPAMAAAEVGPSRNGIGLIYGLRAIERQDGQYFLATGGILDRSQWQTEVENHIIGPQLGVVMLGSAGPLSIRIQATAMAGFNYGDVRQSGAIGHERISGALNRPLYARPVAFNHITNHDEFSPSGELRGEATYRLSQSASLVFTWSGTAIRNALLSENRTRWQLPDMGLIDPGDQHIFVHNLFCGINVVR